MQDFKRLKVWEKSHALVLKIYKQTAKFPKEEVYGLTSQIRRAAVSVAANICEGCARGGDNDFARFLRISLGSASEVKCELLIAFDLGFLSEVVYKNLTCQIDEIMKMLSALIQKFKSKNEYLTAKS